MKKNVCIFLLGLMMVAFVNSTNGQDASLEWAIRMGGSSDDYGRSITVDANGNVYTTGNFRNTVDFDPGPGTFNLTTQNINDDVFISKLDASGAFVWAKQLGGFFPDYAYSIKLDTSGNVYTTGTFQGTADFDPGPGIFNLTSAGQTDIFISKLDASGAFLWAKRIGGTGGDGASIAVDASGNVYATGGFQNTIDFDPGLGIFNLTSVDSFDVFIFKLHASGTFLWAKSIGGTGFDAGSSINVDASGNIYTLGRFQSTTDFDPGPGVFNLTPIGLCDIFISKLDTSGAFLWAKNVGGPNATVVGKSIEVDASGNVYTSGYSNDTIDVDPGSGIFNLGFAGQNNSFISKLDTSGAFLWAKNIGGTINSFTIDLSGNIYNTGSFLGTVDFDPGLGVNLTSLGSTDIFVSKLDASGAFLWAKSMGGGADEYGYAITIDLGGNIYVTGHFRGTADFDPGPGVVYQTPTGLIDLFILKLFQKGVKSVVYQDFNQNCIQNVFDGGLANRFLMINPGNLIVTANSNGLWHIDSLPAGNYTITADTSSNNWQLTCPITQNFTVIHPDSITITPSFGFISTNPCSTPDISIHAPFLRPGFPSQVNVQACNQYTGTALMDSVYVIVELNSLMTVNSSSMPYTNLGNNQYQVNIGNLYPGQCVNFWLSCTLSVNAVLNSTLCVNAKLYPVDSCALDSIPSPYPTGQVNPCTLPWDHSSLQVVGFCVGDSVRFVIYNTGVLGGGDMDCFAPVRVYLDGAWVLLDSIQLVGGDSIVFMFDGNGQTWHIEADQHPLHPGNSHPNATIANCGTGTGTPNLVNIFPQDDADPVIDIYCGLVTGSYDPNDKTGYPLGVGSNHDIEPNQDLEYVINFQNTGTDTAFTVVIRDTLSMNLDIFLVHSGVSSHDYTFRMYGPRVLEWTFNNIMLPDSNVNEAASHGFITFKVNQIPNLPDNAVLQNSASIYFDFNAPIFTNTSWHTVNRKVNTVGIDKLAAEQGLDIKIYPNPTTGNLTIDQTKAQEINISILDNLGRVLHTQQSNDVMTNLNINHLPTGIYYISINNGKVVATQKVVKR